MEGFFILLKSRNTNMNVVFSASFEFPLPSSEWIILWSTPAVWSNCLNTGRRILRFYQCQWIATVSGSLCCLTEPGSAKSSTKKRSPKPINNIFTGKTFDWQLNELSAILVTFKVLRLTNREQFKQRYLFFTVAVDYKR